MCGFFQLSCSGNSLVDLFHIYGSGTDVNVKDASGQFPGVHRLCLKVLERLKDTMIYSRFYYDVQPYNICQYTRVDVPSLLLGTLL